MGPRLLGSSAKRMCEREEGSHNLQTRMRCGQIPDGMAMSSQPQAARFDRGGPMAWAEARHFQHAPHSTAQGLQQRICISHASAGDLSAEGQQGRGRDGMDGGSRSPPQSADWAGWLASLSPQPTGGEPVFAGCLASRDLPLSASGPGRRDIAFMWETPLAWSRAMGWWWPKNTGTQGAY